MNPLPYAKPNWLIHKINNRILSENLRVFRGVVLDLGCGRTPYKKDIQGKADAYIGVDWPNSLHDNTNVDVFADLKDLLPFRSNSVDTVALFQVLEHISEPQQLLFEVYRLLRIDGHLFITVPFMWHVHEAPYDYYRYTRYGLEYILSKAGFQNIMITENTGFWQTFALKFNYYTTKFAHGPLALLRIFWIPVWFCNQLVAPWLDRISWHPQETASYTVLAQK